MYEVNYLYKQKECTAKVFNDYLTDELKSQIKDFINTQQMTDGIVRFMPDVHGGKGCMVGTTAHWDNFDDIFKLYPSIVGNDIGCGVLALNIGKINLSTDNLKEIDEYIKSTIPLGRGMKTTCWTKKHQDCLNYFLSFAQKYDIPKVILNNIIKNKKSDTLGTLGGGNHFIEIGKDSKENVWLTIHTGSRDIGAKVEKYFTNISNDYEDKIWYLTCLKDFTISTLRDIGLESEINNVLKAMPNSRDIPKIKQSYVVGHSIIDYINSVIVATEYAKLNRALILELIIDKFNFEVIDKIESVHNYIDISNKSTHEPIEFKDSNYRNTSLTIRKGATSAKLGENLLIPLNMADGIIIGVGKGNKDWNYSAPHGAGRNFSRTIAKKTLSLDKYIKSMENIYSSVVDEKTLDESPLAYKDPIEIVNSIGDNVDIIDIIRPIYNVKGV